MAMSEQHRPIFHDPDGRRWRKMRRLGVLLSIYGSLVGIFVCISVLLFPATPLGALYKRDLRAFLGRPESRQTAMRKYLAWHSLEELTRKEAWEVELLRRKAGEENPYPLQEVTAFYANWDPNSYGSLWRHIDALTAVMPTWLTLSDDDALFQDSFSPATRDPQVLTLAKAHGVAVLPVLSNVQNDDFRWEPLRLLLTDPDRQRRLADRLHDYLLAKRLNGINIDFELPGGMSPAQNREAHRLMRRAFPRFVALLRETIGHDGLQVTLDVPPLDNNYDYQQLTDLSDRVIVMQYDEHTPDDDPGPIAGQDWIEKTADKTFEQMDPDKTILGIGNYCYDWPVATNAQGRITTAHAGRELSLGSALNIARQTGNTIRMDEGVLNPYFTYQDTDNQAHIAFLLDAVTAYNQVHALAGYEPRGVALWYLGAEDPSIWSFLDRKRLNKPFDIAGLKHMDFHDMLETDAQPSGDELTEAAALSQPGSRTFTTDGDGLITSETYQQFPTPYVLRQFDGAGKTVALTFDDGPDRKYTPQILRILREEGVHGTFFVLGEHAAQYPEIIQQCWRDGNELGNHTYSHPHLALVSPWREKMELNATERILESLTGHTTRLFRPPYGDMPDTGKVSVQDIPLLALVQRYGFITVGMNIDPKDYEQPDPLVIVKRVEDGLQPGNHVILLHDAGGNRDRTMQALPLIIRELKAKGYRFVTISELMGVPQVRIFPAVTGRQLAIAGVDRLAFEAWYGIGNLFRLLFILVIVLGILRLLVMAPLAVLQRRRPAPSEILLPVTVAIPAYNEETMVCRTVQSVLDNDYPDLRVIVVDDGSKDDTLAVLQAAYGDNLRVTIVHQENGGKATALNTAFALAETEVVIGMDGDTLFAPDTVRRLVRQFADPRVGAVAGNVKVGNRTNLLARWQGIEYITSQNFDRAAYSTLNAVAVIPGAVGAWRRSVVLAAGGFETDTLAEDADLTFKIRLQGYYTRCDNEALAYTEVPDELPALAKQRFRWAFGILQTLWKHRRALWNPRYGAFSTVVMPGMWLFSFILGALAPVVDVMVILSLFNHQWPVVLYYAALFFVIDLVTATVAYSLDREDRRDLAWLFWQRLFYREFMYYIVLRALLTALHGSIVGWGKLQRKATVSLPGTT